MYENERNENVNSNSEVNTGGQSFSNEQIKVMNQTTKKSKKGGGAKKFWAAVGLGLAFGAVAGCTYVGVTTVANRLLSKVSVTHTKTVISSDNGVEENISVEEVAEDTNANNGEIETVKAIRSEGDIQTVDTSSNLDVTQVVENTMPSIVSITNKSVQEVRNMFGSGTYAYESESQGSGIIIGQDDSEILIVTNNHVVSGASSITVGFVDDEIYEANVKGTDEDLDLAVVSVKKSDVKSSTLSEIKVAVIGDSDELRVGEQVVAIGNALGYGQSVTTGIVSALDRDLTDDNVDNPFIQTDAAINPGNSGGALFNLNGELIGINESKIASTYVEGVGYSIPVNNALPVIETLMNRQTREKLDAREGGYLGISGIGVDKTTSQSYGIPVGVYIQSVEENSPAQAAGLGQTDVISKFDGISVSSINDIRDNLDYYKAGETVELEIYRIVDGEYVQKTVSITLGDRLGTALDPDVINAQQEEQERAQKEAEENQNQYSNPFSFFGN